MRSIYLGLLIASVPAMVGAAMMGHGMSGGMMGGNNTSPVTPPPKDASPTLRRGYDLTQRYCIQCHAAPSPRQHTAAQWPQVLARMQNYMRQQHRNAPDAGEQKTILAYLGSNQAEAQ